MHMTQIFRYKGRLHVIVSVIILGSQRQDTRTHHSQHSEVYSSNVSHLHTLVVSSCQRHKNTFRWQGCTCLQDCSRRHMSRCSCYHNFRSGSLHKYRRRWVTIALIVTRWNGDGKHSGSGAKSSIYAEISNRNIKATTEWCYALHTHVGTIFSHDRLLA